MKMTKKLSKFIGTDITSYTDVVLSERLDVSDRTMHKKEIEDNLSNKYKIMLNKMVRAYGQ